MASKLSIKQLFQSPSSFLALGFGSGLSPWAPGTCGSVVAIPLIWIMTPLSQTVYLALVALFFLIGIVICNRVCNELQVHDHPAIVWDEIVGMMLVMAFVPNTVVNVAMGFILFRIFDVLKPWPIRYIDKNLKGGLGVMFDDIVAAIFAAIVLFSLTRYLPGFQ